MSERQEEMFLISQLITAVSESFLDQISSEQRIHQRKASYKTSHIRHQEMKAWSGKML